ncbi:MAG TPA: peptide chain release factor 2 [Candidatus Saccharimonadales bacterium]|nr:peptide chain release factor 2 [Candidatus Saccharimonadales bacterium]
MDDLLKRAEILQSEIDQIGLKLKVNEAKQELSSLKAESEDAKFWQDSQAAQNVMKRIAKLENRISPWEKLTSAITELIEMLKLKDETLESELMHQLEKVETDLMQVKGSLKFNGPYDDHDAIISIYAGAGGTDAQDWAQMLLRMYVRFCEKNNWSTQVVEESAGEEAGLKSVTLEVNGDYAYGKLKGEHGVHRLVRLSPYNADNLRQTSFAKVEVIPKIESSDKLDIEDKDLKIDVYRSGGHGGQSVNTTDSAVRITHLPTGITVAIQNERSQLQNRELAMTILSSKLAQLQLEQHQEKLADLKGPNQSAEWGNQIRSYVLHPYKQVKDLRTRHESTDPDGVLDGNINSFIEAYLDQNVGNQT